MSTLGAMRDDPVQLMYSIVLVALGGTGLWRVKVVEFLLSIAAVAVQGAGSTLPLVVVLFARGRDSCSRVEGSNEW